MIRQYRCLLLTKSELEQGSSNIGSLTASPCGPILPGKDAYLKMV
jgi:hypothetical protein